jgi:hypothetical protein
VDERPPPEVTIRDPARPDRPVDVPAVGDDQPPRILTRPRVIAAGAVLFLVAGVAGVSLVRERQDEAAQEPPSAVDLRLRSGEATASGSYDRQSDTATLELLLPVRNDGRLPVTVLRGGVGGYGLVRPVELPAGGRGLLLMDQRLDCSTLSEIPKQDGTVELSVRTAPGAPPRRVELIVLIPFPDEHVQHVCG